MEYGLIKTLVFSENNLVDGDISNILKRNGFKYILNVDKIENFNRELSGDIDVVISDSMSGTSFIGDTIRDLRHGRVGQHPFPIIITILLSAGEHHVRAVIDSGVDDLMLVPVSSAALIKRVASFAEDRRPFIVTFNYIGPERRQATRAGSSSAPTIRVPNPLRSKALGQSNEKLKTAIEEASYLVNQYKIERDCAQLSWLVERIRETMREQGPKSSDLIKLIQAIDNSAIEICHRAVQRSEQSVREGALAISFAAKQFLQADDETAHPLFTDFIEMGANFTKYIETRNYMP